MDDKKLELLFVVSNYLAINNPECLKALRIFLERNDIVWNDAVRYLNLGGFSTDDMIVGKEERQDYLDELNSFIDFA